MIPNPGPTSRNFGLNLANGKGDKSRVTDIKRYRENFSDIDWSKGPSAVSAAPSPIKEVADLHQNAAVNAGTTNKL